MVILIPDVDIICCKLWLGFEEDTYAGDFLWGIFTPRKLQFVQVVFGRGSVTLSNPGVKDPVAPLIATTSFIILTPCVSEALTKTAMVH